ncbi:MAG: hypothetical protein UY36_C0002G0002 [Parcubacteria group bacterium GW2011_GWA1_49_11]|uniref:Protease PrsW n=1 Tax=Candidatus Yanofskybacteria bacterium RIFCSPHIGHO2_01_FULL_48_25b TaxID=1802672 RepID=A0A1F8F392_9BACT|nr:MAG: hypothetical protein UY36_C0002G0002 [Parcubacteria group bacterium GW2011_GWA1_49_11]OGN07070.1 MAG: hypothetical protein A2669_02360 [Candidatus Yanofskybacteria bacterium RIFCSPHIGHO2_01_FULL_48_25b]
MSIINAVLLVGLGLLPSLIWMIFFYRRDCHPEPKYLVTKTFLMGIIISPIAVVLQVSFTQAGSWAPLNALISQTSLFFLWAAFVEEFIKYYAVRVIALRDPSFDEPVDAIIYMMMAGLGFAAIENILVLFRTIPNGFEAALSVWALRAIGATLLHALASGILGYFLALSWFFRQHRAKLLVVGLAIATFFHFTFNMFLTGREEQVRSLLFATGLLLLMSFLLYVLFVKMKKRSHGGIQISPAVEKNIVSA